MKDKKPVAPQSTQAPKQDTPKALGSSRCYRIKKFGLYAYQAYRIDPETQLESKIGEPNVYGVVASSLVDLMFRDINPESR